MRQRGFLWLIITCFLLLSSSEIWGEWELKLRGDRESFIELVHFINPKQGWAVGFARGTSFWTDDGGETWVRRNLNISSQASFPNALDGWQPSSQLLRLIEGPYPPIGVQLPFERSFDGGLSWVEMVGTITEVIEINAPSRPEGVDRFKASASDNGFYFLDSQTGFVFGWTWSGAFYIGKTTDGGKTWTLHLHWGIGGVVRKIMFSDASNGWVLVGGGTPAGVIYRTNNGGRSWEYQVFSQMEPLSIAPVTKNEAWMVLRQEAGPSSYRGEVWRSTDSGQTWEVHAQLNIVEARLGGGIGYVGDILFIGKKEGWMTVVGLATSHNLGLDNAFSGVLHTKDGGRSWEKELDVTSEAIASVEFFTYDVPSRTLWVRGCFFETLYKRTAPVVGVSPCGKLPLTWGQLKQSRKEK